MLIWGLRRGRVGSWSHRCYLHLWGYKSWEIGVCFFIFIFSHLFLQIWLSSRDHLLLVWSPIWGHCTFLLFFSNFSWVRKLDWCPIFFWGCRYRWRLHFYWRYFPQENVRRDRGQQPLWRNNSQDLKTCMLIHNFCTKALHIHTQHIRYRQLWLFRFTIIWYPGRERRAKPLKLFLRGSYWRVTYFFPSIFFRVPFRTVLSFFSSFFVFIRTSQGWRSPKIAGSCCCGVQL